MIGVVNNHPRLRFSHRETQRTVGTVLQGERSSGMAISVIFVDNRFIRRVNRKFLDHDAVTDVISFPFRDGMGPDAEVYVNLDRARSQAKDYRVTYTEEVRRLLIHGTLHLFGYTDATKRNRVKMRKREDLYLTRLS